MNENIDQIQKQTFRYYYQDGLVELAVGFLFAVIGIDTWILSITPPGTPIATAAWILLPIFTIGGIIGVQRFVKSYKDRLVHPRTGYIDYKTKPNRYRWLVIGFTLALTASVFILPYGWLKKGSATGGMILCVILTSIGAQVNLRRLIYIGLLGTVLGFVLAFLPYSENAGLALTFAFTGLALLIAGGLALRKYLAENPLPEDAGGNHGG
jgi:hypothetical protein